jgi:hypothetical protein
MVLGQLRLHGHMNDGVDLLVSALQPIAPVMPSHCLQTLVV